MVQYFWKGYVSLDLPAYHLGLQMREYAGWTILKNLSGNSLTVEAEVPYLVIHSNREGLSTATVSENSYVHRNSTNTVHL